MTLGIVLRWGLSEEVFLMSEVPLYVIHTTHGRAKDRTLRLDAISHFRGAADETTWCAPYFERVGWG